MRRAIFLAVPMMLAGCNAINPEVAQLERFQTAKANGDWQSIVAQPVDPSCHDGCGQLHAIRGDACLALAMKDRAPDAACPTPTPEARARLACAADAFKAARKAPRTGAGDLTPQALQGIGRSRAEALYCAAELETVAGGKTLAQAAAREAAALPSPNRDLLGGWAALYLARPGAGANAERCAQARRAENFARSGLGVTSDDAMRARLNRLAQDAALRRQSIDGCGG